MEAAITREIYFNILRPQKMEYHIFGSSCEGTTTLSMGSDIDQVMVFNDLPVVTDPVGTCLLLVQDQTTPPGYFKLQVVRNGNPLCGNDTGVLTSLFRNLPLTFCTDKNNRLVCSFDPSVDIRRGVKRHGPEPSSEKANSLKVVDTVFALQCRSWPACASEWTTRYRSFNLPSPEQIEKCKTFGCLFVSVGHPNSAEQDLLWRVSFSHQERSLVTNFNSVQLKCYTLLKVVKNKLIVPQIPESMTTYHLKTCMLYLIENTPNSLWKPNNLLACLFMSLKVISQWAVSGTCPNYFIPAENMFDRHVRGDTRQFLHQVLQHLIKSADCKFLFDIKTGSIGELLKVQCDPSVSTATKLRYRRHVAKCQLYTKLNLELNGILPVFEFHKKNLHHLIDKDTGTSLESIQDQVIQFKTIQIFTGYTEEQVKRALRYIVPYLELSLLSTHVAAAIEQCKASEEILSVLASDKWHELCTKSDSFSSKLKHASAMYILGYHHVSIEILATLTGLVRFTNCVCYSDRIVDPTDNGLVQSVQELDGFAKEDPLKNYIIPCICFTPVEKTVCPSALHYEMIRTAGQSSYLEHILVPTDVIYGDWAFVDGQFLLQFLLFHNKLNMESHVITDIANRERLANAKGISHRETCYNLLGWVYKEQGDTVRAMECWKKSIEVKPLLNAAFWHIAILCFETIICTCNQS